MIDLEVVNSLAISLFADGGNIEDYILKLSKKDYEDLSREAFGSASLPFKPARIPTKTGWLLMEEADLKAWKFERRIKESYPQNDTL